MRATVHEPRFFFLLVRGICDNAMAAVDSALSLVRLSQRAFDAVGAGARN